MTKILLLFFTFLFTSSFTTSIEDECIQQNTQLIKIDCAKWALDMANSQYDVEAGQGTIYEWASSVAWHYENCDPDMIILEAIELP